MLLPEQRSAKDEGFAYLHVETDVGDTTGAVVQVNVQLIQRQLLLQKLAEVTLQQVSASHLLHILRPWDAFHHPRHLADSRVVVCDSPHVSPLRRERERHRDDEHHHRLVAIAVASTSPPTGMS